MWHYDDDLRSADYMPAPIPWERVKNGVFVFLGKRQVIGNIDCEDILSELDRLLPLYKYVESGGAAQPVSMPSQTPFEFRPKEWSDKVTSTVATQVQRQLDIALRHNEMQKALYRRLVSQYGKPNVTYEDPSGVGTRVDVVVQQGKDYWFYEIKTATSPRACLREAIGQLLEYAFWPALRSRPDWSSSAKLRSTKMVRSTCVGSTRISLYRSHTNRLPRNKNSALCLEFPFCAGTNRTSTDQPHHKRLRHPLFLPNPSRQRLG